MRAAAHDGAVLHHHDPASGLTGMMEEAERHLQRHLDGGRSAVGIKDVPETGRRDIDERSGQRFGRFVGIFGEDDLVIVLTRRLNGLHDCRMPMPVGDHPPGRNRIKNPVAILIGEICAFRMDDALHRRLKRVLGEGMPDGRNGTMRFQKAVSRNARRSKWS